MSWIQIRQRTMNSTDCQTHSRISPCRPMHGLPTNACPPKFPGMAGIPATFPHTVQHTGRRTARIHRGHRVSGKYNAGALYLHEPAAVSFSGYKNWLKNLFWSREGSKHVAQTGQYHPLHRKLPLLPQEWIQFQNSLALGQHDASIGQSSRFMVSQKRTPRVMADFQIGFCATWKCEGEPS